MSLGRQALVVVGAALMSFGAWLVIADNDPLDVAPWVLAPVLVHDLLIAPVVLGLVWLGHRVLPRYSQTPLLVALVVCGALTAVAASVLTRAGARPDNPSLLDRNYVAGYLAAIALTLGIAVASALLNRRRTLSSGRAT
jgi:hypothetical protein